MESADANMMKPSMQHHIQHERPHLGFLGVAERYALRRQITGDGTNNNLNMTIPEEEGDEASIQPQPSNRNLEKQLVEITGLELLIESKNQRSRRQQQSGEVYEDDDSYSIESYANDSFVLAEMRLHPNKVPIAPPAIHRRRSLFLNQSQSSSLDVGDNDSPSPVAGGEHNMYGYGVSWQRRSSLGSALTNESSENLHYGGVPRATRRSSVGSFANDSVYNKQRRNSSISSYANDSIDWNKINARNAQRGLPSRAPTVGHETHGADHRRRRSSMGSVGTDSVDYGYGRVSHRTANRGSPSYDELQRGSSYDISNHRRNSLGTSSHHQQASRRYSVQSMSSVGVNDAVIDFGGLVNISHDGKSDSVIKRRLSNASCCSGFSQEVYDTQYINTGGAGRAA